MPVVRAIVAETAEDDYPLSELVAAVVKSPAFRMNTKTAVVQVTEGDEAEGEPVATAALAPGANGEGERD
jgi:hypothetical protein